MLHLFMNSLVHFDKQYLFSGSKQLLQVDRAADILVYIFQGRKWSSENVGDLPVANNRVPLMPYHL